MGNGRAYHTDKECLMRFLADMPISRSTIEYLCLQGHDVLSLSDLGLEQAKDIEIAHLAVREKRILLTIDMDFASITAISKSATPPV